MANTRSAQLSIEARLDDRSSNGKDGRRSVHATLTHPNTRPSFDDPVASNIDRDMAIGQDKVAHLALGERNLLYAPICTHVICIMIMPGRVEMIPRVHRRHIHADRVQRLHYQARTIHSDARRARVIPNIRSAHVVYRSRDHGINRLIARSIVSQLARRGIAEDARTSVLHRNGLVGELIIARRILVADIWQRFFSYKATPLGTARCRRVLRLQHHLQPLCAQSAASRSGDGTVLDPSKPTVIFNIDAIPYIEIFRRITRQRYTYRFNLFIFGWNTGNSTIGYRSKPAMRSCMSSVRDASGNTMGLIRYFKPSHGKSLACRSGSSTSRNFRTPSSISVRDCAIGNSTKGDGRLSNGS